MKPINTVMSWESSWVLAEVREGFYEEVLFELN